MKENRLRVLDANLLYLICGIFFLTVGAYFQTRELLTGLIITQYLIILAPPVLYVLFKKTGIKRTMRFNKLRFKHGLLVAMITILMYPIALSVNTAFMFLLSLLGNLNVPQIPMPDNAREYVIMMGIVSLTAGFCEEILFRGFIMRGYERLGKKRAIIISAVMFGVFHFNIYNLLGPMILGLMFGYLVMVTDSIFAGVIGHMVNNGFALTLGYGINFLYEKIDIEKVAKADSPELSTTVSLLISALFFLGLGIFTGFLAYQFLKIIKRDMKMVSPIEKIEEIEAIDLEEHIEHLETTETLKFPVSTQHKPSKKEYIPLLLMIPVAILLAFLQIKEIIQLG